MSICIITWKIPIARKVLLMLSGYVHDRLYYLFVLYLQTSLRMLRKSFGESWTIMNQTTLRNACFFTFWYEHQIIKIRFLHWPRCYRSFGSFISPMKVSVDRLPRISNSKESAARPQQYLQTRTIAIELQFDASCRFDNSLSAFACLTPAS